MAQVKCIDEKALLDNCLQNKEWAQKELYLKYSSELYAICWRYAKDESEAKDILQEGFIKIFTHIRQYKATGTLIGWMKKVVVNTALNYIKKHRKEFTTYIDVGAEQIVADFDTTNSYMDTKDVLKCFAQLSYPYKTILGLYIIEGYTYKELSKIFRIEEAACRIKVYRAKIKLKEILQNENNIKIIKINNEGY